MFQDAFFYCLVFDPSQKTLLADKGEIRVGSRYQTEVTNLLKEGKNNTVFYYVKVFSLVLIFIFCIMKT